MIDNLILYSHIRYHGDIFVTSNTKDFQKHHAALSTLGAKQIMKPAEAVAYLTRLNPVATD